MILYNQDTTTIEIAIDLVMRVRCKRGVMILKNRSMLIAVRFVIDDTPARMSNQFQNFKSLWKSIQTGNDSQPVTSYDNHIGIAMVATRISLIANEMMK